MGSLGSIFAEPTTGDRGPDIRVTVEVPRGALGDPDGYAASVPETFEQDGEIIRRVRGPGDPAGKIILRLPEDVRAGTTLRLRGQGGARKGCPSGDLYLRVELVDVALEAPRANAAAEAGDAGVGLTFVFILAAIAGALVWLLSR